MKEDESQELGMEAPDSLTLRWTKRGRIGDDYGTFVVDIETLEAALIMEDEPFAPIEFVLDTIRYPSGDTARSSDPSRFMPHLLNALRGTTPTCVDFNDSEDGRRVTVSTSWSGISSVRVHPNGTTTAGP